MLHLLTTQQNVGVYLEAHILLHAQPLVPQNIVDWIIQQGLGVLISDTLTTGDYMFNRNSGLTGSIPVLPSDLQTMPNMFAYCSGLSGEMNVTSIPPALQDVTVTNYGAKCAYAFRDTYLDSCSDSSNPKYCGMPSSTDDWCL